MKVEVIHYRIPDAYCVVSVIVDGKLQTDHTEVSIDPGAGYSRADWNEQRRLALDRGLTPAARDIVESSYEDADQSEYIDEDREVDSFPPQSVSGHEE